MKTSKKKEKEFAKLTYDECKFIEKYRKLSEREKKEILKMIEKKRQADHTN